MATILQVEQGGTGVQSVSALQTALGLKTAAYKAVSNNYQDTSQNTVPSSYALSEALQAIDSAGVGDVVPISRGGTGATTAEQAVKNLGISNTTVQYPIPVTKGGTGATDAETALANLGIVFPLSVEQGGTGGTDVSEVINNIFGGFPIPLAKGGTGGTTTQTALAGLGVGNPIKIQYGGTGGSSADLAKKNLQLNNFFVNIISNGANLNSFTSPGVYVTQGDYVETLTNAPVKDDGGNAHQAALFVMSNYLYNTNGAALSNQKIVVQILFYLDSTNVLLKNRMFVRCTRTKDTAQQSWSAWSEFLKDQVTTTTKTLLNQPLSVSISSPQVYVCNTGGDVTISFTKASVSLYATKVLMFKSSAQTNLTFSGGEWANGGEPPEWGSAAGKTLVVTYTFIGGKVLLNVFHNDDV